jgi:hypothetical protein
VEERSHEGACRHAEPPLVEAYEAHHVTLWGRRFPVVGRWRSPLWLSPAHLRPQKPVADQLFQPLLRYRGVGPSVDGEELALACHCRREATRAMHLDCVLTRTRPAQRDASTAPRLRLVRGTLDGTPRPLPDPYEARSIRHLDYRQPPTRTTLGRIARPILLTYSEAKVRAFNATTYFFLPSWLQL